MTVLRNRGPRPGPVCSKDPVTAAVIRAVDASGLSQRWVAERAGVPEMCLGAWRAGRTSGNAQSLSHVLEAIGADFVIVDRNEPPAQPIRLLSLNAIRRAVGRG